MIHFLPHVPPFSAAGLRLVYEPLGQMLEPQLLHLPVLPGFSFLMITLIWAGCDLTQSYCHTRIFHSSDLDSTGTLGLSVLIHLFRLSCHFPCNIFCKSAYAFVDLGSIKLIKVLN